MNLQIQNGLDGKPARYLTGPGQGGPEQGKESKPWKLVCCKACYFAEYERCTCKCGGAFHGVGSGKRLKRKAIVAEGLADPQSFLSAPAARIYARLITRWDCVGCGFDLHDEPILHYGHDAGFPVEGFQETQWLFIVCSVCGYQNSLLGLGVKPEADYAAAQKAPPVTQFVKEKEGDKDG